MLLDSAVGVVRSRLASAALLVLACAVAGACGEANQTVQGGELRFDAALPLAPDNFCFKGDATITTTNTTWTSLYADYFGGGATCSLGSGCHGSQTAGGYQVSHFVCPKDDKNACHASIIDPGAQLGRGSANIALVNREKPEESGLYRVLRKINGDTSEGGNRMPQSPTCFFSEADMSRILTWMRAGAPND